MANIALFKPNEDPQYLTSVNTGDYVLDPTVTKDKVQPKDSTILINPDISSVKDIPMKYWKRVGDSVKEMSVGEKKVRDDQDKQKRTEQIESLRFQGGEIIQTLIDAGVVTKAQVVAAMKQKEGL